MNSKITEEYCQQFKVENIKVNSEDDDKCPRVVGVVHKKFEIKNDSEIADDFESPELEIDDGDEANLEGN